MCFVTVLRTIGKLMFANARAPTRGFSGDLILLGCREVVNLFRDKVFA